MNLLLHTIALEPARWTPQRVSQSLLALLPAIASHGFTKLEVFEPHLEGVSPRALVTAFAEHGLEPVMLSSYLNLNPHATSDAQLEPAMEKVTRRMEEFAFQKLRLFPGSGMNPSDSDGVAQFHERLRTLAQRLPATTILLETHDGSLADDPVFLARFVLECGLPNVGLLYQPTLFEPVAALEQFRIQKSLIRHLHLQNRNPDSTFATLESGVIPWSDICRESGGKVDATIEFVPAGICEAAQFDLPAVLAQAREEATYVKRFLPPQE